MLLSRQSIIRRQLAQAASLTSSLIIPSQRHAQNRHSLTTLAIETSCDDTAVAVLSRSRNGHTSLLFNERISSDNRAFKGINPAVAIESHNGALAPLVKRAVASLPDYDDGVADGEVVVAEMQEKKEKKKRKGPMVPDFVCATRGPGIMSNLAVGLNLAKGLAVAWDVPLVGVHHMQAHALTPRLVRALEAGNAESRGGIGNAGPDFPFLSLLVSGGHTQLVLSSSLIEHRIVATTGDIAIGNLLDQTARVILPASVLDASPDVMYGRLLEAFAFPPGEDDSTVYEAFFQPANSRHEEIQDTPSDYDWSIPLPFKNSRKLAYSFSSIHMHAHRIVAAAGRDMALHERRELARHTLRAAFQHLVSRLVLALQDDASLRAANIKTLVVAGGVASNRFLMHVLRTTLTARGYGDIEILAPPAELCTDNAAMIAWAGMEMYEAGHYSDLSVLPISKWPMDPEVGAGIMGVDGWLRRVGSMNEDTL